ncbi:MAG: methyltransferase domain-containing protein [Candidatus Aminicenantes bacterium]|nr:methyltransferase domain-containing protein [Candidatus Aminicenantes bacterium]
MNILKPSTHILSHFFENRDVNLKLMISRYLNNHPELSRNEVTRVVYGVTRKETLIEYIAKNYSNRKLSDTDEQTRILLYIGIYLTYFSRSYPDYAIVNEIVDFAPKRSRGFLNALLRKISSEHENIDNIIKSIKDPRIKYSVSEEIISNLKHITSDVMETLEYLDSEPVFQVRVNKRDPDLIKAGKILEKKNIPCKIVKKIGSLEIENAGQMVREILPGYGFYFQNSGSFAVSAIVSSFKGKKILDCCAAPGTKSITLAHLCPDADIIASDINPNRLKLFIPILNNSGADNIELTAGDINAPPFQNIFDTILIDAPCTSSGTLRKNPDLKNKINKKNIKVNSSRQIEILKSIMSWAGKGTIIIYSVCSFIKDETENVLNNVIHHFNEDEFEIIEPENILNQYGFKFKKGEFGIFLLPDHKLNNDLFYISAIKKR